MNIQQLECSWVYPKNKQERRLLANFFIGHVDKNYISHSEILKSRANNSKQWAAQLQERLMNELEVYTEGASRRAAIAKDTATQRIIALSFVEMLPDALKPHAWIHDFMVESSLRQQRIGSQFLLWLEQEFQKHNTQLVIIESSIHNKTAHSFFKHKGFETCSIVMTKSA